MDRIASGVLAAKSVKRSLVAALPPRIRTASRNAFHRTRLRLGRDPLGRPAQHHDFLMQHLPPVIAGAGGGPLVYLEFGVYQGASLAAAVRAFDDLGLASRAHFLGFDSFEGLPPTSALEGWGPGWFTSSRRTAEWNLRRLGVLNRVSLIEGWFDETCTPALAKRIGSAAVVMFDCDVYSATVTAIDFVEPLLTNPCLLIFDDWFSFNEAECPDIGQVRAMRELLERHPELEVERLGSVGHHGVGFLVRGAGATPDATAGEPVTATATAPERVPVGAYETGLGSNNSPNRS